MPHPVIIFILLYYKTFILLLLLAIIPLLKQGCKFTWFLDVYKSNMYLILRDFKSKILIINSLVTLCKTVHYLNIVVHNFTNGDNNRYRLVLLVITKVTFVLSCQEFHRLGVVLWGIKEGEDYSTWTNQWIQGELVIQRNLQCTCLFWNIALFLHVWCHYNYLSVSISQVAYYIDELEFNTPHTLCIL